MPEIQPAPLPAADKPKKVVVSDEEALNIAFREFAAIIAKHGGKVDVGQLLDKQQRFMIFLTGVERVEKPGSPTVTFKFKAPDAQPAQTTSNQTAPKKVGATSG